MGKKYSRLKEKCALEPDEVDYEVNNGLILNDYFIPEDLLEYLFSFAGAKDLLVMAGVCKKWYYFVRRKKLWMIKYERLYKKPAKEFPWFIYYTLFATDFFDRNLLKNANGIYRFEHWDFGLSSYLPFSVEGRPIKAKRVPKHPDFNGATCCFACECYKNRYPPSKSQDIVLPKSKCCEVILDFFKPHIVVSEWMTCRIDCTSGYTLNVFFTYEPFKNDRRELSHIFERGEGGNWMKKEILFNDYDFGLRKITFAHTGYDREGAGHFGIKMAGGVVKILFDSMKPRADSRRLAEKFRINAF